MDEPELIYATVHGGDRDGDTIKITNYLGKNNCPRHFTTPYGEVYRIIKIHSAVYAVFEDEKNRSFSDQRLFQDVPMEKCRVELWKIDNLFFGDHNEPN